MFSGEGEQARLYAMARYSGDSEEDDKGLLLLVPGLSYIHCFSDGCAEHKRGEEEATCLLNSINAYSVYSLEM